ncbi:MAG: DIP1984 family protein [Chloroflexi bacterium]|nr:DIP1984 family protein [Chloroflexota bacterium]
MKLAEALIMRADKQKRLEQLKERLLRNVKVQQDSQPAEKPEKLLAELETLTKDLMLLIQQINKTNSNTKFDKSRTMSDALAERDILVQKQSIYREVVKSASVTHDRLMRSEIKFVATVKVAEMQKRADDLAKQHRDLDTKIQELNWKTELTE